jgi:hypothetical protein
VADGEGEGGVSIVLAGWSRGGLLSARAIAGAAAR